MIAIAASLPGLTTPPSVIRLTDAASKRPVLLIGTMHYNPHSIATVQRTVSAAARQRGLHAAAIELCDSRWNSTAASSWQEKRNKRIPAYKRVLSEDEFQVAWESAVACGLTDVVLAGGAYLWFKTQSVEGTCPSCSSEVTLIKNQAIPCLNCGTMLIVDNEGRPTRAAGGFNTEVDAQTGRQTVVKDVYDVEATDVNDEKK